MKLLSKLFISIVCLLAAVPVMGQADTSIVIQEGDSLNVSMKAVLRSGGSLTDNKITSCGTHDVKAKFLLAPSISQYLIENLDITEWGE